MPHDDLKTFVGREQAIQAHLDWCRKVRDIIEVLENDARDVDAINRASIDDQITGHPHGSYVAALVAYLDATALDVKSQLRKFLSGIGVSPP